MDRCKIAENNIERVKINTYENGLENGFQKVIQYLEENNTSPSPSEYMNTSAWANWIKQRKEEILK